MKSARAFAYRYLGPDPHMALSLMNQFGLYNTVFTNADDDTFGHANTDHWCRSYNGLLSIVKADSSAVVESNDASVIKKFLLRDPEEDYRAWLLCALVPWARAPVAKQGNPKAKPSPSPAYLAVREGMKADNKISSIIAEAVRCLDSIIEHKDIGVGITPSINVPQKRKFDTVEMGNRVIQGKAIRSWGPTWRSSAMYALLVQIWEAEESRKVPDLRCSVYYD